MHRDLGYNRLRGGDSHDGSSRTTSGQALPQQLQSGQAHSPDHPLRKIDQFIDFDFIYQEVADEHNLKGNVSVPSPLILKLMLLYQDQLQRTGGTPSQSGCLLQAKRREFLTQVPIFRQLLWQFMILSHPAGPGA